MKKIILLAAFLLVGYIGQSQVYRISTVGESKQFVILDTVSGVRERPYLNREVLADTTSQGTINIYRQLSVDYLKPIGFPTPKGHPYTSFLDGNNSDATFESAAAVLDWFADNTGFNSAGGSASTTVDVKKYGAKGDGVTDDTEAIQKAILALNADGDKLLFPKGGTYLFSQKVGNDASCLVNDVTNLTIDFEGATLKSINSGVEGYLLSFKNCDGLKIRGGTIDNETSEVTGKKMSGIIIRDSDHVEVSGIDFPDSNFGMTILNTSNAQVSNCTQTGVLQYSPTDLSNGLLSSALVYAVEGTEYLKLTGSYAENIASLILTDTSSHGLFIHNNTVVDSHDTSIYVQGTKNVVTDNKVIRAGKDGIKSNGLGAGFEDYDIFSGNYIEGAGVVKSDGGTLMVSNGVNSLIQDNILVLPNSDEYAISHSQTGIAVYGLNQIVSGNNIQGHSSASGSKTNAIQLGSTKDSSGSLISGNHISKCENAIELGTIVGTLKTNISIIGNKIENCYRGVFNYQESENTLISDCVISGNRFSNIVSRSINLYGAVDFIINGNTGISFAGAFVSDYMGVDNVVTNNIIDAGTIYTAYTTTRPTVTKLKYGNISNGIPVDPLIAPALNITAGTAPSSATDTGVAGEVRFDSNYIYRCTATNTWKRAAISTW